MHIQSQLNGEIALHPLGSVGRTRRRPRSAVTSPQGISRSRAERTASVPARDEIEAYALHAFAANGFGDATLGAADQRPDSSRERDGRAVHAHRFGRLAQSVEATLLAIGTAARRMYAKWKQRQQARATYVALSELDARTLRDLGFDRSEIRSVAAEVAGDADSTRARLVLTQRELPV
jgi:uncharacterized protein YjiS (DUF1127 family)